nr:MAG TPA: hypothetical protein [Caudoviricetes sp.]
MRVYVCACSNRRNANPRSMSSSFLTMNKQNKRVTYQAGILTILLLPR